MNHVIYFSNLYEKKSIKKVNFFKERFFFYALRVRYYFFCVDQYAVLKYIVSKIHVTLHRLDKKEILIIFFQKR